MTRRSCTRSASHGHGERPEGLGALGDSNDGEYQFLADLASGASIRPGGAASRRASRVLRFSSLDERERIVEQILRSASVVLGVPVHELSCETAQEGGRWVARVGALFEREGASEREALGELLSWAVWFEEMHGRGMIVTPTLARAIELLRVSRRELMELVRKELEP